MNPSDHTVLVVLRPTDSVLATIAAHYRVLGLSLIFMAAASVLNAQAGNPPPAPAALDFRLTETAPRIDGNLDDAIWQQAPLGTGDWQSYNPLYGETLPHRTTVVRRAAVTARLPSPAWRRCHAGPNTRCCRRHDAEPLHS